jgi:hypothetical protein
MLAAPENEQGEYGSTEPGTDGTVMAIGAFVNGQTEGEWSMSVFECPSRMRKKIRRGQLVLLRVMDSTGGSDSGFHRVTPTLESNENSKLFELDTSQRRNLFTENESISKSGYPKSPLFAEQSSNSASNSSTASPARNDEISTELLRDAMSGLESTRPSENAADLEIASPPKLAARASSKYSIDADGADEDAVDEERYLVLGRERQVSTDSVGSTYSFGTPVEDPRESDDSITPNNSLFEKGVIEIEEADESFNDCDRSDVDPIDLHHHEEEEEQSNHGEECDAENEEIEHDGDAAHTVGFFDLDESSTNEGEVVAALTEEATISTVDANGTSPTIPADSSNNTAGEVAIPTPRVSKLPLSSLPQSSAKQSRRTSTRASITDGKLSARISSRDADGPDSVAMDALAPGDVLLDWQKCDEVISRL